ncbi:unnamed protein product [Durusdinium trenchii]|uniref:N-acetylgalactosaminide beta-1,3-galactosyltransferase n=1 Tax=Durusdinium trenchii TaxID=1381693 RepID=A0ABP0SYR1_9DINO
MPDSRWHRKFWTEQGDQFVTLAEYDAVLNTVSTSRSRGFTKWRRPAASEVLVLVMASHSLQERVALLEHTWSDVDMQRLYLVDDWLSTAPQERQWRPQTPSSNSAGSFGMESNYWDAQSRQLEFMQKHPNVKSLGFPVPNWVVLADDDTFIHVDALLDFIAGHDPEVPALFGYILSDAHVLGYDYPCGGAGMLLSFAAYDVLAPRLLADCPLLAFNDLTLGFCAHSQSVPVVHHPGMHCAPDVNRAMRTGENLLDIQKGIAVHRLIGFQSFIELVGTLDMLKGQVRALLQRRCLLAARSGDDSEPLDSRRFFWSVEAFEDAVSACRGHAPRVPTENPTTSNLHLDFFFFGGGLPVAGYHKDRSVPLLAEPTLRAARWPEWMEQLRHLKDCTLESESFEMFDGESPQCKSLGEAKRSHKSLSERKETVSWKASWRSTVPRLSRLQVEATGYEALAANAEVDALKVKESFEALEANRRPEEKESEDTRRHSSTKSWLEELKSFGKKLKALKWRSPGRRWIFVDFSPSSTFLNVFESLRILRGLSNLYHDVSTRSVYLEDVRGPVDLGAERPPPLALAYEYFDLNVEQAAGLWLNGVALQRILRCRPLQHPIKLDPEAHANDWEKEEDRLALMWHNAIAVDIFRALRFCGVVLLHTPSMVPHALSYLPYSTYRRSHPPSVATSMSIGNIASREQMWALSQLAPTQEPHFETLLLW